MKRLLLCTAGLIFLAAPAALAVEKAPLMINGRLLGNMVVIQGGIWGVPLEDVSRALGASVSLEPIVQLQGKVLTVREAAISANVKANQGSLVPAVQKVDTVAKIKTAPGQFLRVQKSGPISSNIVTLNGKAYVPVADLVHALGDGSVHGNFSGPLQPNGVNLHVNSNPNGIIAILIGL